MHRLPRTRTLVFAALALAAALLTGCGAAAETPANTIGVNALAADPTAYTGEIAVKGIVQKVDAGTISIIDETEYATCGLTPCNSAGIIPLFLPTSGDPSPTGALYDGELPKLEESVVVIGKIVPSDTGMVFDVARIQRGSDTIIEKR